MRVVYLTLFRAVRSEISGFSRLFYVLPRCDGFKINAGDVHGVVNINAKSLAYLATFRHALVESGCADWRKRRLVVSSHVFRKIVVGMKRGRKVKVKIACESYHFRKRLYGLKFVEHGR